jgi:2-phosphosulfolactate phosphatase
MTSRRVNRMSRIDLYPLPSLAPAEWLAESTVIVVDLLRASTTICMALAAGAECVMPFTEIEETLEAAKRFGRANVVLGGERYGQLIAGFDLGNSPAEYTPERVGGRRILFTTTNGARALRHARQANRVLVGSAVNCLAVARAVEPGAAVSILCAGTDGVAAPEDELAGGAIADYLSRGRCQPFNEAARTAYTDWMNLRHEAQVLGKALSEAFARRIRDTDGGRNLLAIGHEADLPRCSQLNSLGIVPTLDAESGELRPA